MKLGRPSKVVNLAQRRRKRNDGEALIQRVFVRWLALAHPYVWDYTYAVPNGEKRTVETGAKLKAMGVRRGIPDIHIALSNGVYHSLYIELKYGRNKATAEQEEWAIKLRKANHRVDFCWSVEEAQEVVLDYFDNTSYLGK